MRKLSIIAMVSSALLVGPAAAWAGTCSLRNTTGKSFTIESGNVSNQRVSGNTLTSIASGKIIGKSDDGKGIGGSCKDGDKVKIVEDKGVYLLLPE